jgi:hypothetical protein
MISKIKMASSSFFLGFCTYACNNSQFTSKNSPTQEATSSSENPTSSRQKPDYDDQTLNTIPSLNPDKIDKVHWQGCCPSYSEFDSELKVAPQGENWAAKAYSKIESFYFEKLGSGESGSYRLEKKILEYYSDENCILPLKDEFLQEYNLTPIHKTQNISGAIRNLQINSDGLSAQGLHSVIALGGDFQEITEQKVEYKIRGHTLRETIILENKSAIPIARGYKITCNLRPLNKK